MKIFIYLLTAFVVLIACSEKKSTEKVTDTTRTIQRDSTSQTAVMYLEDVLDCKDLKGLETKYGVNNIQKDALVQTGDGDFKVTKLFPNTPKEVEVYWKDGKDYLMIQDVIVKGGLSKMSDVAPSSLWESKEGLRLGMKMSDIIALNNKNFTITGLGWDLGGNVVSWEGGKLANKNISIRFNDYSGNNGGLNEQEYNAISGDREFDTQHPSIQKLNPIVDELSVYLKPDIDATLGQKMTKEVERKQIKR